MRQWLQPRSASSPGALPDPPASWAAPAAPPAMPPPPPHEQADRSPAAASSSGCAAAEATSPATPTAAASAAAAAAAAAASATESPAAAASPAATSAVPPPVPAPSQGQGGGSPAAAPATAPCAASRTAAFAARLGEIVDPQLREIVRLFASPGSKALSFTASGTTLSAPLRKLYAEYSTEVMTDGLRERGLRPTVRIVRQAVANVGGRWPWVDKSQDADVQVLRAARKTLAAGEFSNVDTQVSRRPTHACPPPPRPPPPCPPSPCPPLLPRRYNFAPTPCPPWPCPPLLCSFSFDHTPSPQPVRSDLGQSSRCALEHRLAPDRRTRHWRQLWSSGSRPSARASRLGGCS